MGGRSHRRPNKRALFLCALPSIAKDAIYTFDKTQTYSLWARPQTENGQLLGTEHVSKSDEFSEKFRRGGGGGGGVIFNPKIYIAKFGPLNRAFSWHENDIKGSF